MDVPGRGRSRASDNQALLLSELRAHTALGAGRRRPRHWVQRALPGPVRHIMALTDLPAGAPAGFHGPGDALRGGLAGAARARTSPPAGCSSRCSRRATSPARCAAGSGSPSTSGILQARPRRQGRCPPSCPRCGPASTTTQLPDSVRHIHFNHSAFGDRYATDGTLRADQAQAAARRVRGGRATNSPSASSRSPSTTALAAEPAPSTTSTRPAPSGRAAKDPGASI